MDVAKISVFGSGLLGVAGIVSRQSGPQQFDCLSGQGHDVYLAVLCLGDGPGPRFHVHVAPTGQCRLLAPGQCQQHEPQRGAMGAAGGAQDRQHRRDFVAGQDSPAPLDRDGKMESGNFGAEYPRVAPHFRTGRT